jgi:hypothetical protein
MCDYTQREYSCGHFRWIASKWCRDYTITHKRCQPNVTHFEYRYGAEPKSTSYLSQLLTFFDFRAEELCGM